MKNPSKRVYLHPRNTVSRIFTHRTQNTDIEYILKSETLVIINKTVSVLNKLGGIVRPTPHNGSHDEEWMDIALLLEQIEQFKKDIG